MTTYEKIIKAMEPFGWPHAPDLYTGKAERFFYYNYADDRGLGFGDDGCDLSVAYVQVHVWLPMKDNIVTLKRKIRDRLVEQGFTYPSIENLTEDSMRMRHLVFECEIEEEE